LSDTIGRYHAETFRISFSVTNWSWIAFLVIKATPSAKTLGFRYSRESAVSTQALVDRSALINSVETSRSRCHRVKTTRSFIALSQSHTAPSTIDTIPWQNSVACGTAHLAVSTRPAGSAFTFVAVTELDARSTILARIALETNVHICSAIAASPSRYAGTSESCTTLRALATIFTGTRQTWILHFFAQCTSPTSWTSARYRRAALFTFRSILAWINSASSCTWHCNTELGVNCDRIGDRLGKRRAFWMTTMNYEGERTTEWDIVDSNTSGTQKTPGTGEVLGRLITCYTNEDLSRFQVIDI